MKRLNFSVHLSHDDFLAKVAPRAFAMSFVEEVLPWSVSRYLTGGEENLPDIYRIMSQVFFTDVLVFNLEI